MIVSPSCALQFKIVGARRGQAPNSSLCISHGLDVALNSTEEMRFPQAQLHKHTTVGCKVATPQ